MHVTASLLIVVAAGCGGSKFSTSPDSATTGADTSTGSGGTTATSTGNTSNNNTSSSASGGNSNANSNTSAGGTSSGGTGTEGASASTDGTGATTASSDTSSDGAATGTGGTGGSCSLTCELETGPDGAPLCRCAAEQECNTDSDCGLATNIGECCTGCLEAYPRDLIASEPCLSPPGSFGRAGCETPVCTDVLCPDIDCATPIHAACEAGECVPKYTCPDGMIEHNGTCVPPCTNDDECVAATRMGGCCNSCAQAFHVSAVSEDPCLVGLGDSTPKECQPDPEECALVLCPQILCIEPGAAVCAEHGACVLENSLPNQ